MVAWSGTAGWKSRRSSGVASEAAQQRTHA